MVDNRAREGSRLRKLRRKQQRQQQWQGGGLNGSRQRQVMSWQQHQEQQGQGQGHRGLLGQLVSGPLSVFKGKKRHSSKAPRQNRTLLGQDGSTGDERGTEGEEGEERVKKTGLEVGESLVEQVQEQSKEEDAGQRAAGILLGDKERQETVHLTSEEGNASDHQANNRTGAWPDALGTWLEGASEIAETLQLVTAQLAGFVLMVCRAACTAMGLQWAAGGDGLASGDIVCLLVGYEMLLLLAGAVLVVVVKVARSRGMSLLGLLPSTLLALVHLAPVIEEHVMASLRWGSSAVLDIPWNILNGYNGCYSKGGKLSGVSCIPQKGLHHGSSIGNANSNDNSLMAHWNIKQKVSNGYNGYYMSHQRAVIMVSRVEPTQD